MKKYKVKILKKGIPLEGSGQALIDSRIKYPTYKELDQAHNEHFKIKDKLMENQGHVELSKEMSKNISHEIFIPDISERKLFFFSLLDKEYPSKEDFEKLKEYGYYNMEKFFEKRRKGLESIEKTWDDIYEECKNITSSPSMTKTVIKWLSENYNIPTKK